MKFNPLPSPTALLHDCVRRLVRGIKSSTKRIRPLDDGGEDFFPTEAFAGEVAPELPPDAGQRAGKIRHPLILGLVADFAPARVIEVLLATAFIPPGRLQMPVVRLLEISLIRMGNEEYARDNKSYGLTTMKNRHATVRGTKIKF